MADLTPVSARFNWVCGRLDYSVGLKWFMAETILPLKYRYKPLACIRTILSDPQLLLESRLVYETQLVFETRLLLEPPSSPVSNLNVKV